MKESGSMQIMNYTVKNTVKPLLNIMIAVLFVFLMLVFQCLQAQASATDTTLTLMYQKTTEYLNAPTRHDLIKLNSGGVAPAGAVTVKINGESYYYMPAETEDRQLLQTFSTYGNAALVVTTDPTKAVYSYDGVDYGYDTNKFVKSVYTLTKVSTAGPDTIKKYEYNTAAGEYELNNYKVALNTDNFNKTNTVVSLNPAGANGSVEVALSSGNKETVYYKNTVPAGYDVETVQEEFPVVDNPDGYIVTDSGPALHVEAGDTATVTNKSYQNGYLDILHEHNDATGGPKNGSAYGGVIYNEGTITEITADFIGNYIRARHMNPQSHSKITVYGGAIANSGTIGNIYGDFVNNYSYGEAGYNNGSGAISNLNKDGAHISIGNIVGNFIGNYAFCEEQESYGGAIGNYSNLGSITIGNIKGDFVGNRVNGLSAYGGAIYEKSYTGGNVYIGDVTGNFVENYASATGSTAHGGAIYKRAENNNTKIVMGDITGDFIGNYTVSHGGASTAQAATSLGGAIYNMGNNGTSSIGSIVGDFIGNYAHVEATSSTQAVNAFGGAIYNHKYSRFSKGSAIIGNITGEFINNYVYADSTSSATASGGAIYNTSTIADIINTSFVENYAIAISRGGTALAQGGAIYTQTDLTLLANHGYESTFSGNYVQMGDGTDSTTVPEAIYVDSGTANLTFRAEDDGKFLIQDQINGVDGYGLNFVGDATGAADVNNLIKGNPNLTVDTVTVNYNTSSNGEIDVSSFNSVKVLNGATFNYVLDVDLENKLADKIVASQNSSGLINISGINLLPAPSITGTENFVLQVLITGNDNLRLSMAEEVVRPIGPVDPTTEYDTVTAVTKWTDGFYKHEYSAATLYAVLGIQTKETTDDSIGVTFERRGGTCVDTPLGDTLSMVNQADLAEKSFETDDPTATYQLSDDLGETKAGTFNITGAKNENSISTLDLNGRDGFDLTNETRLNLKDVKLTGNDTVVTVTHENASIGVDGAVVDGDIVSANQYNLDVKGDSKFNGSAGKANMTMSEGSVSFAKDTFKDSNLNLTGGTVNLANDTAENYNIATLASSEDVTYVVDFDVMNKASDTITTTNASSGPVVIDSINFINGTFADLPEDMRGDLPYTVRVLYTQNDDLYLVLSDNAKRLIGDNEYIINEDIRDTQDAVEEVTPWDKVFKTYRQVVTDYGDIEIKSSGAPDGTENDSIGITYSRTEYGEKTETGTLGDTLKVVNQADLPVRTFKTEDVNATYTVTEDLGETTAGDMNVVGKAEIVVTPANPNDPSSYEMTEINRSTLDFNGHKGFELNNGDTRLTFKDVKITGATSVATSNDASTMVSFDNVEMIGNESGVETAGSVEVKGSSTIASPIKLTEPTSKISVNGADTVVLDTELSGVQGSQLEMRDGVINMNENAKLTSLDTTLSNTTVNLQKEESMQGTNLRVQETSTINMTNKTIATLGFGDMLLAGDLNVSADVDLANRKMDMLTAESFNPDSTGFVNVNKLNLISATKAKEVRIPFTDQTLASHVKYTGEGTTAYSRVYKYKTSYSGDDGYFTFTRGSSGNHTSYNPSVLASQISALTGIYGSQLETFRYAFQHSDSYMENPAAQRLAEQNKNKYAFSSITPAGMYSPLMTRTDNAGFWIKPYAVFEKVPLKHGPNVSNINYGVMAGFDTSLQRIRGGFDRVFTYYLSYNGSFQNYDKVDIFQNGALIGFTTSLYKGNFFNATTLNFGATIGDASTRYGSDTFTSLLGGIANKTGYNIEFKDGRFIIQPSLILSYSFINTFDFKSKSGAQIKSDPYSMMQITPGIKFIGNTKNGWQPYLAVQLVWNILLHSHVTADGVKLPEMYWNPYIQYGLGIQKLYADRFTFFGQAMVRNGGRNGVAVTAGMRWILGE